MNVIPDQYTPSERDETTAEAIARLVLETAVAHPMAIGQIQDFEVVGKRARLEKQLPRDPSAPKSFQDAVIEGAESAGAVRVNRRTTNE